MRKDWEVKEIGDIAKISDYVANGSFATLKKKVQYLKDKGYAVLVRYADYTNNFDSKKFVYVNESAYNFLEKSKLFGGEIIMSNVGSVGKLFICPKLGEYMSLAPNSILIRTDNNSFFYYYFRSDAFQRKISEITSKTALPKFNKTSFKKIKLSVPPLQAQNQIVEELDCLTSIIDKQKKQLEELDNLAQSIFYDMFGDPIENEKGWENDMLKNICTKITDGTHDTPLKLTEGIRFITGKHIRKGYIDYDNSDYVDLQTHMEIYKRCNPEFGDVLYTNIGANLGTAAINIVNYEFSMKNVSLLKVDKSLLNGYYLEFILNNDRMKLKIIRNFSKGGAQKFLSLNSICNIKLPLPPLSLQQEFASKIEAIENQKKLIKKSIEETEELFNSRMDYYFN